MINLLGVNMLPFSFSFPLRHLSEERYGNRASRSACKLFAIFQWAQRNTTFGQRVLNVEHEIENKNARLPSNIVVSRGVVSIFIFNEQGTLSLHKVYSRCCSYVGQVVCALWDEVHSTPDIHMCQVGIFHMNITLAAQTLNQSYYVLACNRWKSL